MASKYNPVAGMWSEVDPEPLSSGGAIVPEEFILALYTCCNGEVRITMIGCEEHGYYRHEPHCEVWGV